MSCRALTLHLGNKPVYSQSSKVEKEKIANLLVESVKNEGHRFLEKEKVDGPWHEVLKGERTKASQVFRDLHKHSEE